MNLTTLTGKSLMWCVIFKGIKFCVVTETGIAFTVKVNITSNSQQYLFNININFEDEITSFEPSTGKGKLFPESPSCVFKNKVVPSFTRLSESGGMSSTILKDFFETIDHF